MLQLVKRIGRRVARNKNEFARTAKGILRLARKGQLSWLIYFAEDRAPYRLAAMYAGMRMNLNGAGKVYNFRRNIHRIEKGLSQKHLKNSFAEDYIIETVSYLSQLKNEPIHCDVNTLIWGEAVLSQYFATCKHVGVIAEAFTFYQKINVTDGCATWCPYPAITRPEPSVQYDGLMQLALRRRSVRHYLDKGVAFELVQKAMCVAALSPSACNRQSFKFLFYNEKNVVGEILRIPGGYAGFDAPSVVVVVGSYRGYFDERDANVPIIDASLSVMSFILALETLGLSSVCINWPVLPDRDEAICQRIRLDDDEFVVMLIGVGYAEPQGKIPYSAKRTIDTLVYCNERVATTSPAGAPK